MTRRTLRSNPKRLAIGLAALTVSVLVLPSSAVAAAKAFILPEAAVSIVVNPDGSLDVRERLTFSFSGPFQGAYRDIPRRSGESITSVSVAEGTFAYESGASTILGSTDSPGRFGVADLGDEIRVVWHYRAADERRTFDVSYEFQGLAVAYDDVVDVNIQV